MSARVLENAIPPLISVKKCGAGGCDGIADVGALCSAHRRALRLTTRIQDALLDFFNTRDVIRPGRRYDADIKLGGEYISEALQLLIGCIFDDEIVFDANPIFGQVASDDTTCLRWRVNLIWKLLSDDEMGDDNGA